MSLHDDVELACENAEDGLCTVSPDGFGEVGVPVSALRAILARHPAPTVSDGEREGMAAVIARANDLYLEIVPGGPAQDRDYEITDALLAAGYRKPTLPSVDIDAAWEAHLPVVAPYHVEPLAKYDANAVARGVAYEKGFRAGATAIKAHLLGGE